jgi:hypothetical protein
VTYALGILGLRGPDQAFHKKVSLRANDDRDVFHVRPFFQSRKKSMRNAVHIKPKTLHENPLMD